MKQISRQEYDRKVLHDYAGKGTPLDPDAPGHWVTGWEEGSGTCLWTGVEVVERTAYLLTEDEHALLLEALELSRAFRSYGDGRDEHQAACDRVREALNR